MAVIATDDFTDSNGTLLQNHTPSGGGTWTKLVGAAGVDIEIWSNAVTPSGNGAVYEHSATPASEEYDVELTQLFDSNSNGCVGPAGRVSNGGLDFYLVWYSTSTYLYKVINGSYTSLGTSAATITNDTTKLEIRNATKKVYINGGSAVISSVNNEITAVGKAGLRGYNTNTGYRHDNFIVTDLSSGAVVTPQQRAYGPDGQRMNPTVRM